MRNYTAWAKYRDGRRIWFQQSVRIFTIEIYPAKEILEVFNMQRAT